MNNDDERKNMQFVKLFSQLKLWTVLMGTFLIRYIYIECLKMLQF